MTPEPRHCDSLPAAWAGQDSWTVLDTAFGDGRTFLGTWQDCARALDAPARLHYVGITSQAPDGQAMLERLAQFPELMAHAAQLRQQWFGLMPGIHRFTFDSGHMLLTLCVGSTLAMLRELQFTADSICLGSAPEEPDQDGSAMRWLSKAIARLSHRGTSLHLPGTEPAVMDALRQCGFVAPPNHGGCATRLSYQPSWEPRNRRLQARPDRKAEQVRSCTVVGAGLAGAAVCHALAMRGWDVTVLDAAAQPATGASAVPVGLLVPHSSRDDSARSQLSRAGARLTLQLCRQLLVNGQDWSDAGVLELRPKQPSRLTPHWPASGRDWSVPGDGSIWHAKAAWIKPSRLVQQCLATSGIRFVGDSRVARVHRQDGEWTLWDADARLLARSTHVVLAVAGDAVRLPDVPGVRATNGAPPAGWLSTDLPVLQATDGQVAFARQTPAQRHALPAQPVNGHGSLVPHVPSAEGPQWFAGATYESTPAGPDATHAAHRQIQARLEALLPEAGRALAHQWENGQVAAWRGRRWSTPDRLPVIGPLHQDAYPGLWLSGAMGSRGLTFCVLAAELLAAQLCGEPLPIEKRLARLLDPARVRTKPQRLFGCR